jgi:hypothetical protein
VSIESGSRPDSRLDQLTAWLRESLGAGISDPVPASSDASFRRYFRLRCGDASYIAMDAPPEREASRPFVEIALRLGMHGVKVPQVYRYDLGLGFMLLSDMGERSYLSALDEAAVERLYADALDTLLRIQATDPTGLPPYDETLLRRELALFEDWLLGKHLGLRLTAGQRRLLHEAFDALVQASLEQPRVFVHRDYHSRNLMAGPHGPGVLDFQDAVIGPVTYDLVSLLRDCYIAWPRARVEAWALRYRDAAVRAGLIDHTPDEVFLRWLDLTGIQRHLKASGIFARLYRRDGKPGYLADIPRTLGYVLEVGPDHPESEGLSRLIVELRLAERLRP